MSQNTRQQAMPLMEALYRLTGVEVAGARAEAEMEARMQQPVQALGRLVDAEDRLRLAVDEHGVDDDDDLTAAQAWQQAMAEVEQQMRLDDTEQQ